MKQYSVEEVIGKERLIIETGKMAKQADGAVTVRYGDTMVLVTAVMSKEIREGENFLPLTVEYQERTYAAGKIPGGFFKREGRPSEKEILTARLVDRPIRPLFPDNMRNALQIVAMVISSDGKNDPDILAIIGASCALHISEIPFNFPVGAVRVGRINGEFIVNPAYSELDASDIDLVVVGNKDGIVMLEGSSKEVSEEVIKEAIAFAMPYIAKIILLENKLREACGKNKTEVVLAKIEPKLLDSIKQYSIARLSDINQLTQREQRLDAMEVLVKELIKNLSGPESGYDEAEIRNGLDAVEKEEVRKRILQSKKRIDGRSFTDIREITCEVGIFPRTHGSSLFTRGQTQSLAVTTLGTSADEQTIDALEGKSYKKFMLHYNFPPFSVGEIKPIRGPGRREIGHGALAERALVTVMPGPEEFPYTVRVVSDILESNGSSSMATVCSASLSLMDAGVPIKKAVGGIAMGLIKEGSEASVLTDIAGLEDHFGDMDFKVTGTDTGITAIQMDLKISGIDIDLITRILSQAKPARFFILDKIREVIAMPREKVSNYAPKITAIKVEQEKISQIIGPGGKNIRRIIEETGADIDISDDNIVSISSVDEAAVQSALNMIRLITQDAKVGEVYTGKFTRILNFGAFCELVPGKEGLIHVSELDSKYVKSADEVVKIGQEVKVKVIGIDEQNRINLSIKQAK